MTAPTTLPLSDWIETLDAPEDATVWSYIDQLKKLLGAIDELLFDVETSNFTCVGTFSYDWLRGRLPVVRFEVSDFGIVHLKQGPACHIVTFDLVAPVPFDFKRYGDPRPVNLEKEFQKGFPEGTFLDFEDQDHQRFTVYTSSSPYKLYTIFAMILESLKAIGHARYS